MMYCVHIFILCLCLSLTYVLSTNSTESTTINSDCPPHCRCTDRTDSGANIVCDVASQLELEQVYQAVSLYTQNESGDCDLKLIGGSNIITSNLGFLPPLNSLDLSASSLKLAPHMFKGLRLNSCLNLSANGLDSFPDETFTGIVSIGAIDLSNNWLRELNASSFLGVESLSNLDLSFNNITLIHEGTFSNLSQLEDLNLESNKLKTFSFTHLSPNASLDSLNLKDNLLTSLYLKSNQTGAVPFHEHSQFDISENLVECSCSLAYFLEALPFPVDSLINVDKTLCNSPENLRGQSIDLLDSSGLACIAPEIFMSYPVKEKDLLTTSTITLECHANGFPNPSILWTTPWGDHFLHDTQVQVPSALKQSVESGTIELKSHRKYKEPNVLMVTSIEADGDGHLVISKIRGSMYGNYTCLAFNPAGNASRVLGMSLHCGINSTYTYSLIIGGYCASGFLIFGFLVGFVKMLVVWLRHKHYFNVPYFSKAPSTAAPNQDTCTVSVCNSSMLVKPRSPGSASIASCPDSTAMMTHIEEEEDSYYDDVDDETQGLDNPTQAARQRRIRETLEEARGRLRDGVERRMERVKKNVQHIRESGSVYVHSIKESGSSAANRMKAGMALGVETVKYQLQSFKELCGTGDMGQGTISTVSVETNVDSHQQLEVVKQVTFV